MADFELGLIVVVVQESFEMEEGVVEIEEGSSLVVADEILMSDGQLMKHFYPQSIHSRWVDDGALVEVVLLTSAVVDDGIAVVVAADTDLFQVSWVEQVFHKHRQQNRVLVD